MGCGEGELISWEWEGEGVGEFGVDSITPSLPTPNFISLFFTCDIVSWVRGWYALGVNAARAKYRIKGQKRGQKTF